jgi:hypothetical protein
VSLPSVLPTHSRKQVIRKGQLDTREGAFLVEAVPQPQEQGQPGLKSGSVVPLAHVTWLTQSAVMVPLLSTYSPQQPMSKQVATGPLQRAFEELSRLALPVGLPTWPAPTRDRWVCSGKLSLLRTHEGR